MRAKENLGAKAELQHRERFEEVKKKAVQDIITDVETGVKINTWDCYSPRELQVLSTDTNGYKAAVIIVLLGPFKEKFWWW